MPAPLQLNSMGFGHPEFSSEFEFEFEFEFFAFRLGVTKLKLKTHKTHKTHESFGLSLSLSFQVSFRENPSADLNPSADCPRQLAGGRGAQKVTRLSAFNV